MYCIYKVTNKIDGKVYIGKTNNLPKRKNEHYNDARRIHLFSRALHKYGKDNFTWEVVEHSLKTLEEANDRERYWIKECRSYFRWKNSNGYNMTEGGDGGSCWNIKKIAAYDKRGKLLAVFESVTEAAEFYGISGTTSISRACDNTEMTCNGMMFVSFDDVPKPEIEPFHRESKRKVPIYQLDLNGNIVKQYPSITEACQAEFRRSGILGCANGRYKQSDGFIWRYEKNLRDSVGQSIEPVNSLKGKYILQFTLDGQFVRKYNSCAEAARQNGIPNYKIIHKALNSETHYSSGYKWYRNDDVDMSIPR